MKKISFIFILFLFLFANISYATVAPKNILLSKCFFTYTNLYKHLKKNKAFAYARVALGENDYCTWTHDASSVENARSSALSTCKQQKMDMQCKIVDVNNIWLVEEGDFSTIVPADNTPLSKEARSSLINKAKNIVRGECLILFNTHLQDKGHKVFSYSVDTDGQYACGVSREHQTLRQAALIAAQRCEEQRILLKEKAPKHPCLSFSDGKQALVGVNDFNLTLHQKTNTYLDLKTYQSYVNKAKKHLHGACLNQYKYFLRVKDHRAFYMSKNTKGEVACGHSFDQFTIAAAKKIAQKNCEASAKIMKITQKCKLFSLDLLSTEVLNKKRILK